MNKQPALAGLTEQLNLHLKEFKVAVKKHKGKDRDDPTYGETYLAVEDAFEIYRQAFEAWHQEIEKPPAGATAEGTENKNQNDKLGSDFNVQCI